MQAGVVADPGRGRSHSKTPDAANVIVLMAAALERVVAENLDLRRSQPTSFDAVSAPGISIHRYLSRIRQYTKFHDECFVVALVYMDRLFALHKAPFLPTPHNVHRLIITSVLVASKFYDGESPSAVRPLPPPPGAALTAHQSPARRADTFHSNSFMAQVGGISVGEMNKLEIELCLRLNWELHILADEYDRMAQTLVVPTHPSWHRWRHVRPPLATFSSDEELTPPDHAMPPSFWGRPVLGRVRSQPSNIPHPGPDGPLLSRVATTYLTPDTAAVGSEPAMGAAPQYRRSSASGTGGSASPGSVSVH